MRDEIKAVSHLDNTRYVNLCKSVLYLEQNIFFVGIINNHGRLVNFAKKQNKVTQNLESMDLDMICMQARLYMSMQSDHDESLSRFGHCITEREKTTMLTIPTIYGTMLVISSNKIDSKELVRKIFQVANDSCFAQILNPR
jgi:hypothetical protein